MKDKIHKTAMKIVKILIESELSISDQLKVIKNVKERLDFCKTTGIQMKQLEIDFK